MIGKTSIALGIAVGMSNLQVVDNSVSIVSQNIENIKHDSSYNMVINALSRNGDDELNMDVSLTDNLNKLDMIYNLSFKDDNSIFISKQVITVVKNILYNLKYQPEVFPTLSGNIQLEYENENGKYLEIEVTPDGNMKIFKINDDGKEIEGDFIKIDDNIIGKEVDWFYE